MGTTSDTSGRHMVGVADSVEALLGMCVPFCDAGTRAGQPVIASFRPHHAEALRRAIADPAAVDFLPAEAQYQHPQAALQSLADLAHRHAADHTIPVRVMGEPPMLAGLVEDSWLRYEAVTNDVLDGWALDRLCVYRQQEISPAAATEVRRTHPLVMSEHGEPQPSPEYQDPVTFVSTRRRVIRDPVEQRPPAVVLRDPSAGDARQAIATIAHQAGLDAATADDLVVAANEVLTNAVVHGRAPVALDGWAASGRAVIAVHDHGEGITDPRTGLQPGVPDLGHNGLGLWIAHQLLPAIAMARSEDGFTVRLAATREAPDAP